jgi:hypothetical protein
MSKEELSLFETKFNEIVQRSSKEGLDIDSFLFLY